MKVLVVIVTYNGLNWVDRCLGSIFNSSIKLDAIVIDNGSTDGTINYIQTKFPEIILKKSDINLGFGKANNIGLQYALDHNYDYVYLLNQDAWLMPDTIESLIKVQENHPEYGILSPFQIQANMQQLDVNFNKEVCSYKSNQHIFNDLFFKNTKEIYEVDEVMAAHWLLSVSCIRLIGGFSPIFPHYGEDVNYASRVKYHGLKVGIVPSVIAIHDRAERKVTREKLVYANYISYIIFLSNPFYQSSKAIRKTIKNCMISSFRLKSFHPIMDFIRVMFSIRKYNRLKSISKVKQGAFLLNEF